MRCDLPACDQTSEPSGAKFGLSRPKDNRHTATLSGIKAGNIELHRNRRLFVQQEFQMHVNLWMSQDFFMSNDVDKATVFR